MKCKNCGTELSEADEFCFNCGEKNENQSSVDTAENRPATDGVDLSKAVSAIEAAEAASEAASEADSDSTEDAHSENPEEEKPADIPIEVIPADSPEEAESAESPEEAESAESPEETESAESPEEAEADIPIEIIPADSPEEAESAESPEEDNPAEAPKEVLPDEAPRNSRAHCSNCGAEISPDDKFCLICGVPVDTVKEENENAGSDESLKYLCTNCGEALAADDVFCPMCGQANSFTPLSAKNEPEESSAQRCPECGAILNPGDRFCLMCGRSTDAVQTEASSDAPAFPELICSKCGSELLPGDRFCQKCGNPTEADNSETVFIPPVQPVLPVKPVQQAPNVPPAQKCARCGSEILAGERFCQKCGNPVQQAGFIPASHEPANVEVFYPAEAPESFVPVNNPYGSNNQPQKAKKSKAGKIVIIIIIILLVLSLIATGVLLFLYRDDIFGGDSDSGETVSSETVSSDTGVKDTSSAQAGEVDVSSEEPEEVSSEEEDIEVPYNSQIIKVNVEGDKATLTLEVFDEKTGEWKEAMKTKACIGKNGATDYKVEGDKCTPKGTFDLNFVFGMSKPDTKLNFKQVKKNIVWIDDPDSDYYNTWQNAKASYKDWSSSKPVIKKFEQKIVTYRIAFNFNGDCLSKNSAESGRGSGLFIEGVGSKGKFKPSYGDIRISSGDMKKLLKYLDSSKHPQVVIY